MAEPIPVTEAVTLYRGDTRIWNHALEVSAGVPLDLTGYEFRAQIRATEDSPVMAEMAIEIVDAPGGLVRRTLTATEAAKLVPTRARWDFEMTAPDGFCRTVVSGPVKIVPDVSRAVV